MSGAYTAKPDLVVEVERPAGWDLLWPYPGPNPPGYTPPEESGSVPDVSDDSPPDQPPDKIEQDWEITLNTPDPTIDSPQFHISISPINAWSSLYAYLTFNYGDTPEFTSGGMQFQLWDGAASAGVQNFASSFQLNTAGEVITLTLRMRIQDNDLAPDDLKFTVHYGESDTWGSFGTASFDLEDVTPVADLSGYKTSRTILGSDVTFGDQRVALMRITQVRYYKDDVLIGKDDIEHIAHQWP